MIFLKLRAGLGNQLFQYAYARALALRNKTGLKIDTSWYASIGSKDTVRTYGLDTYNVQAEIATPAEIAQHNGKIKVLWRRVIAKISRDMFGMSDHVYYPKLAHLPDGSFVEGFWNTEKYFKEFDSEIRNELMLKVPLGDKARQMEAELKDRAASGEILILVHVRRGDYVSNQFAASHHGAKGTEYYRLAINKIVELLSSEISSGKKIRFMLASDDMKWTSENITPLVRDAAAHAGTASAETEFSIEALSNPTEIRDYEEIYLMSLCHHFIIANSSFSWWGAWLSKTAVLNGTDSESAENAKVPRGKIVIGPKAWVSNPSIDTSDVLPEEWIKI